MAGSDLGTRIKRARERMRWSQQRLADELGVGVRSVGAWERGEAVPRNALGALEAVLAPYFTADEPTLPPPPPPPTDPTELKLWDLAIQDMSPAEAWELIEEYRRLKGRPGA